MQFIPRFLKLFYLLYLEPGAFTTRLTNRKEQLYSQIFSFLWVLAPISASVSECSIVISFVPATKVEATLATPLSTSLTNTSFTSLFAVIDFLSPLCMPHVVSGDLSSSFSLTQGTYVSCVPFLYSPLSFFGPSLPFLVGTFHVPIHPTPHPLVPLNFFFPFF